MENKENLYYYYHNWTANHDNKIHKGSCPICNNGLGQQEVQVRFGSWVGPFQSLELVESYIRDHLYLQPMDRKHDCI